MNSGCQAVNHQLESLWRVLFSYKSSFILQYVDFVIMNTTFSPKLFENLWIKNVEV